MSPEEFRAYLRMFKLTQQGASQFFGHHGTAGQKWASGAHQVPPEIAILLRLMLAYRLEPADVDSALRSVVRNAEWKRFTKESVTQDGVREREARRIWFTAPSNEEAERLTGWNYHKLYRRFGPSGRRRGGV